VSARRAVAAAALLVGLGLASPSPAGAEDVSAAELRSLASRAAQDPGALGRLRAVTSVDGAPADVAGALDGAMSSAALRERLATLSAPARRRAAAPDAGRSRAAAREIVAQRRFKGTRVQGPFRPLLDRIGRWLEPLGDLVPRLDRALPGGRALVWVLLALAVAALGWLIAGRTIRRRAALAARTSGPGGARAESPGELERAAEAAERRGAHEEALRLRFRAGLLRLDERGAIALRPSTRTEEVSRVLGSDAFDRLAAGFDDVVYGERPASADDVAAARREWESVLR